jgi:2-methylcitrate dehydratase PrpD
MSDRREDAIFVIEITERLADLCARVRYRDLPQEVVSKGKECILDTLGCMLAGCKGTEAAILLKYVEEAGGRPEATIIGFGKKTNAPNAALVNGTLGHALDFDDSQHSLMGHPSVVILPAVLSLGEKMKSSGEAMLEAFILGFEVTCKVGRGLNPRLYNNGWHATSVIGTLGASMAAGKLLGLDSGRMASVLGLSASLACGLRENFGTMTKPFHAGKAAGNGVLSALLVRNGFTASQQILEAKRGFSATFSGEYGLNRIVDHFGNPFEIVSPGVHLKPYPSCLETHSIIEATLFLAESHDIHPEDVESVECGIAPLAVDILIHRNPQTGLQGKFSAPYAVTTALLHRKASLEQFTDQAVRDVRVQAMNQRVNVFADPEMEKAVQSAIVTIRLKNGQEFTKRVDITSGHPERPMSLNEIIDKYSSCAGSVIKKEKVDESVKKILDFEKLRDVRELITSITVG